MADAAVTTDVIVIGAGMAGLTAARRLSAHGLDVIVLDKGRAVGGRMATRRIGSARFDHGAQHFSARSREFAAAVSGWIDDGVAREWYRSHSRTRPERGVEPRHAGTDGMRGIPEHLARGLDVRTGVAVERIVDDGSVLAVAGGMRISARAGAVVTPPVPQTLELLGGLIDDQTSQQLDAVSYDPCLAVMAELDAPSGLIDGHLALEGPVAWIADNQHKGISEVPAATIHSSPQFAAAHLDGDPLAWAAQLVEVAAPHLGGAVIGAIGHRWRFAQPRATLDTGCLVAGASRPIVVAGEAFAGARVEGAFTSGQAAATAVLETVT